MRLLASSHSRLTTCSTGWFWKVGVRGGPARCRHMSSFRGRVLGRFIDRVERRSPSVVGQLQTEAVEVDTVTVDRGSRLPSPLGLANCKLGPDRDVHSRLRGHPASRAPRVHKTPGSSFGEKLHIVRFGRFCATPARQGPRWSTCKSLSYAAMLNDKNSQLLRTAGFPSESSGPGCGADRTNRLRG
jgi:hypothetical protein